MKTPLHILCLEHDGKDAGRIQAALEVEGIACKVECVKSRTDFIAALERGNVDMILSDFPPPAFNGSSALEMARSQWPGIPFIIVSATPLEVSAQPAQTEPLPGGTESLLVVEDELAVCHLANNVLENQGYTVLRARNGREALRVAREHRGSPIRLAITDVIMPQMDGTVMAKCLKSRFPDLKILFTSGYTDDAIVNYGVLEPDVAFLAKPYSPAKCGKCSIPHEPRPT